MVEGTITSSTYSAKGEKKEEKPKEKKEERRVVTIRLPQPVLEEVIAEAKRRKVSRSRVIKEAVVEYLRKQWVELSRMKRTLTAKDREEREREFRRLCEEYWRKRLTDPEFRPEDWEQVA